MKAKPLAVTIIILAILAFAADAWLARSSGAGLMVEQGQLVPVASMRAIQESKLLDEVEENTPAFITAADSLKTTRTVAQKLKDLTLVANIEKKLFRVKELKGVDFRVSSSNGLVELSGSVSTEKKQQQALAVAKRVAGVKSVTNNIDVQQ